MTTRKATPTYLLCFFIMFFLHNKNYAQVGIGTTDPKTALDINGALSLREGPNLILSNGNSNDILLNSTPYSFYRITGPTANFGVRRITSTANADGQLVTLVNFTDKKMTIRHNVGGTSNVKKIFCPSESDMVISGKYASITLQYNSTLSGWVVVNRNGIEEKPTIDSVTLESDYNLTSPGFSDIPGMSLTFIAQKSSMLVFLTGSGGSTDIASGIGDFRIRNTTTGTILGGTHEKLTTFDDVYGINPAWSISFSKLLTGLTVGASYTINAQALLDVTVLAGPSPALDINAATETSHHHLTLSVLP